MKSIRYHTQFQFGELLENSTENAVRLESDKKNFSSINWLDPKEIITRKKKTEALCHALIHLQHEILNLAVAVGRTAATSERETQNWRYRNFLCVVNRQESLKKKITNRKTSHHWIYKYNICINGENSVASWKKYEKHAEPIFFNRCEMSWSKKVFFNKIIAQNVP